MTIDERTKDISLEILKDLGARPAVSFAEGPVAAYIWSRLKNLGLSPYTDRYGNLVVRLPGSTSDTATHPSIAFVAHMDHPGFEALEATNGRVIAGALGGVPQASFSEIVPVRILLANGTSLVAETDGHYGPPENRKVSLAVKNQGDIEYPRPVVFDLTDFEFDGELVHMRALDDLAGCAGILAALQTLVKEGPEGDVFGVFTRAEEVGLVGARLMAESGTLPQDTLVVSLEASRMLPGATMGDGPVIRVGDASLTFDAEAEAVLLRAREKITERMPDFKAQRQLMSGGTCEASAFRYYGYRTTGIAFPLGNYHNATPNGNVAAEYIHVDDMVRGVELIIQAAHCSSRGHESSLWQRLKELPEHHRRRLAETADSFLTDSNIGLASNS